MRKYFNYLYITGLHMTFMRVPLTGMSRLNFAWEVLRRIPAYSSAYYAHLGCSEQDRGAFCRDAHKWGLLQFC
ncbi:transcriptional regulator domain-containing protein [Paremcibacter congregatus]|uniref:transcriptional regulator domain-containing protein n=1 Tax=Paremcibacter congregatus TaxID=2043170 RepID=UPI00399FD287